MKTNNWIIVSALVFAFVGCDQVSDLREELSAEDEEALGEMEHAFEGALAYHDSLVWCTDTSQTCVDSIADHYEDEFHEHMEEWEEFHSQYSHLNVDDDHHHGAEVQHHHGNGGHEEEDSHEEEEDEHGHGIESHLQFNELILEHSPYHPE